MKKFFLLPLTLCLLMTCACTGRSTLEQADANAPVTVEDLRDLTTLPSTSVVSLTQAATSPHTGLPILAPITFNVNDPENSRGLSTDKKEHSFGVAKNGIPHEISKATQEYFESTGYKAICYDTKSAEKVIYLTFDCGWENGCTDEVLDTLKEKKVPAAFFCTLEHIKSSPDLIARMITEGHIVGNHSAKHPNFAEISRQRMADEILECENYLRENYGYSTKFFRFPEGSYNESALELISSMGMTSVFWSSAYADWDVSKTKGAQYAFDTVTARLHPGAVLLLHSVSPDNAAALGDIIDWARNDGYVFKSLNDIKM
ncbi:MAG: polysaccharide deacetylase family protein [Clostridia bacterium]|nr:polysaccharide deacetylase family protein [Clostridia bacterium]